MPVSKGALARLRKALRRHLLDGWTRAVFATPTRDGERDERVVEGPGEGTAPSDEQLEAIVVAAVAAAQDGYVKHTYVLNEHRRAQIDARYGKVKIRERDAATVSKIMGGKQRPLRPDRSADLLRAIGIMNADGTISAKNAKKYKQVNHLVELLRPAWERLLKTRTPNADDPLRIIDLACGNSYLTFVLAEVLGHEQIAARIHGVDLREDVIERSRARAEQLGFEHVTFSRTSIEDLDSVDATLAGPVDLVVSLHACDTATDDALALAIELGAASIFAVPCCHHELAAQLGVHSEAPIPAIARHGLMRNDYAALLSDGIRIEILEGCGYKVDAVEFIATTHTPKNLLIRAHRSARGPVDRSRFRLDTISQRCQGLGLAPRLLARLRG